MYIRFWMWMRVIRIRLVWCRDTRYVFNEWHWIVFSSFRMQSNTPTNFGYSFSLVKQSFVLSILMNMTPYDCVLVFSLFKWNMFTTNAVVQRWIATSRNDIHGANIQRKYFLTVRRWYGCLGVSMAELGLHYVQLLFEANFNTRSIPVAHLLIQSNNYYYY